MCIAIIDGDQANLDRSLTKSEISSIDSYALEAFFEGLPREYRTELKAKNYSNLADTCSKVIMIHKRLEREENRYRNTRNLRDNTNLNSGYAGPRVLECQPLGNPPTAHNSNNNNNNARAPYNSDSVGKKICSYCKNFGHLVNKCRK